VRDNGRPQSSQGRQKVTIFLCTPSCLPILEGSLDARAFEKVLTLDGGNVYVRAPVAFSPLLPKVAYLLPVFISPRCSEGLDVAEM